MCLTINFSFPRTNSNIFLQLPKFLMPREEKTKAIQEKSVPKGCHTLSSTHPNSILKRKNPYFCNKMNTMRQGNKHQHKMMKKIERERKAKDLHSSPFYEITKRIQNKVKGQATTVRLHPADFSLYVQGRHPKRALLVFL